MASKNDIIISFWIILSFSAAIAAADCPLRYRKFVGHTACLTKSDKATAVPMTPAIRKKLVDKHNALRSSVVPPATDMLKISWDEDLAMLTARWVESGSGFEHDEHRYVPGAWIVGQNLWMTSGSPYDKIWEDAMESWWNEKDDYTYGNQKSKQGKVVGHYTQMAWANSYRLGCAAAEIDKSPGRETMLVCNYAPAGNYRGKLPYSKGSTRASSCKTKSDGVCDCGSKKCHYGTLNSNDCKCKCKDLSFYRKEDCGIKCNGTADASYCDNWDCSQSYHLKACPHKCNVCPFGGIDFVGDPDKFKDGGGVGVGITTAGAAAIVVVACAAAASIHV